MTCDYKITFSPGSWRFKGRYTRGDRSLEGFTGWDLFHSKIAVFMTFSIYKTRLSPCGDGKLLLLLFLLLFISERAYWTVFNNILF